MTRKLIDEYDERNRKETVRIVVSTSVGVFVLLVAAYLVLIW